MLVAGLGIAVVFVALALLLNTVIYAENLATRGADPGAGEAVVYQQAAVSGGEGVVAHANEYNYSGYDAVNRRVALDVRAWSANASRYAVLDAGAASATLVDVTNGTTIAQDAAGEFRDVDGNADWRLAADVTGVRRFELNVSRSSLHARSGVFSDVSNLVGSSSYRVSVTNASASVDVAVFRDTATNEVVVQVVNASGDLAGTCTADADHVRVDLTEGRVGGEGCDVLDVPGVEGAFEVAYENGDQVAGVYGLVVDEERGDVVAALGTDPYEVHGAGVPYAVPAVYDATLRVSMATPSLTYEGNVTAAPEGGVRGPGVDG